MDSKGNFLIQKTPSDVPVPSQKSVPSCLIKAYINRKAKYPSNFSTKIKKPFLFPVRHITFRVHLTPINWSSWWNLAMTRFRDPLQYVILQLPFISSLLVPNTFRRLELYVHFNYRPSWSVIVWNLPLPATPFEFPHSTLHIVLKCQTRFYILIIQQAES